MVLPEAGAHEVACCANLNQANTRARCKAHCSGHCLDEREVNMLEVHPTHLYDLVNHG